MAEGNGSSNESGIESGIESDNEAVNEAVIEAVNVEDDNDARAKNSKQMFISYCLRFSTLSFKMGIYLYPSMINYLLRNESLQLSENTNILYSIYYLGTICGILASNYHTKLGRIHIMYVATVMSLLGWIIIYYLPMLQAIYIGRYITGFGMGFYLVPLYYYTYECIYANRTKERNFSLQCCQTDFLAGIAITLFFRWCSNWINIMPIGIFVHIIPLFCFHLLPKSPYYLLSKNHVQMAKESFKSLIGGNKTETITMLTKIKYEQLIAKRLEIMKIGNVLKPAATFILHELWGITLFCGYLTSVVEELTLCKTYTSVFLLCLVIFVKNKYSFTDDIKRKLHKSSLTMGIYSAMLGIFFIVKYYIGYNIYLFLVRHTAAVYYLGSYVNGWLCEHHLIFERETVYYHKIKLIVPALLCKYATIFILTSFFNQSTIEMSYWFFSFSLVSILTSFTISNIYEI